MHNKLLLTLLLITPFISSLTFAQPLPDLDWKELGKTNPWVITEVNKDLVVVEPGKNGSAPSDAVILFDGKDLSAWNTTPFGEGVRVDRTASFINDYQSKPSTKPAAWTVENGNIVAGAGKGAIATSQEFGDMQLHIEWMIPVLENTKGQAYGNSGVFLMGLYELQVLNSFENPTYSNGQAASIYKQHSPMVNASRKPGEWQTYEVFFTAPIFTPKGTLISPAKMTVVHNGVLVQYNAILEGPTAFIGKSYYVPHAEKLPIVLQDHNNPVRFRNIWVREL